MLTLLLIALAGMALGAFLLAYGLIVHKRWRNEQRKR